MSSSQETKFWGDAALKVLDFGTKSKGEFHCEYRLPSFALTPLASLFLSSWSTLRVRGLAMSTTTATATAAASGAGAEQSTCCCTQRQSQVAPAAV
jgi:hypothetical protein